MLNGASKPGVPRCFFLSRMMKRTASCASLLSLYSGAKLSVLRACSSSYT